ncbi:MAG TPA: amino acid permease [Fimbriimonadaceae bacterium]|nr:amino acid permease [Fimbriimonadaceae bacterium]
MAATPTVKTPAAHLVRQIGLASGVSVVIGSTIGSGIFKSPSDIAGQLPGPLPMLAIWVVGGLIVLCGALTLGEVGGAFPYSGGLYVYVREAYGRVPAFLFGWAQLVLLRPSSIGAVAVAFGEYALRLFGREESQPGFHYLSAGFAVAAVLLVMLVNVLGVKFGTLVQNVTVIAKTGGLLLLILLAFAIGFPKSGGHFTPWTPAGSFSLPMFGLALVSVLWAYDGWADGSYISGEMLEPRKNVPKAILFGTLVVIAVYVLANFAYLAVFSVAEIAKSQTVAADTMSKLVGAGGITFIAATVMISTFGTLNGTILTSPRIFFALAEDKLFFEPISRVHPRYKTPYVSVILSGILGIVYIVVATALSGSKAFNSLTNAFVIGIVPFYALSVGSVFLFRRREKKRRIDRGLPLDDSLIDPVAEGHLETHPHPYVPSVHTPLYPLTPLLFLAACLFLLGDSLYEVDSRVPTIITLGILAAGIPLYYTTIGVRASKP